MSEGQMSSQKRLPVTIITGFLGSGKTTLLNNIIRKNPDTRFAIIENEFGEMGIDGDLVSNDNTSVYELVNGCICCSLSRDFYQSLQSIIDRPGDVDHLLVETTGIADPMSVIDVFMANNTIEKHFEINSVICLADSATLEKTLDAEPESRKQIALSDIVLLNKLDLIDGERTDNLKELIADINPMAKIVETSYAQTNGTPLLQTKAYACRHIEESTISCNQLNLSLHDIARTNGSMINQNGKKHRHDIHAEGFIFDECFDLELFNIWMSSYLYFNQQSLYRVKGILNFKNKNKRCIFQAVKGSYIFEEGSDWKSDESRYSKIVFIGKYIDRDVLEKNLSKLFQEHKPSKVQA